MFSLNRNAQILVVAASFVQLLAVTIADIKVGQDFGVLLFYLIPIAWCAVLSGRFPALFVAVCCASCRFGVKLVEDIKSSSRSELVWNTASELLFFLIFTVMLLKMHQLFEEERALARTDNLTRLLNARAFCEVVAAERERLRRYDRTLSLVYFDLDNFKSVNDRLGHHVGDALLRTIGDTMRANVRQVDQAARLGGDEFAILLPETDDDGARVVLERLRTRMLQAMEQKHWPVTCSMGCVTFREVPPSPEFMLQTADAAMYRSKKGGKNQLTMEIWEPDAPSPETG